MLDTVVYTYGDAEWGDLLTAYDGVALTYDGIGNLTDDGTWEYTWEHGRELASMFDGTTTWTYIYDANGMRTKRTDGTTTYEYVYNGSQLTYMKAGSDELYFSYDSSGRPMVVEYNASMYLYVTNLQGDVIVITDRSGYEKVRYTYDAWGNVLTVTGSMADTLGAVNPLRYRRYVFDQDTGLYYLQSRYYNPEWGRFINADAFVSTGQGILGNNMFAYCLNNPANYSDPSGLYCLCAASRLDSQYAFEQESGVVGGYSQTGTTINGIGAIGTLAAAVALSGGLSVLVSEIGTALSSAVSEVYAFAHSLMDYSMSRFEDRQPRVHHVIPKNKFTHFGSETVNQINYMHSLLESVGLSVDSPDNLLIISHGTHKSMHTKTYISNIYSIMVCAEPNNKASVEWALFLARIYAASLDQYPCGY